MSARRSHGSLGDLISTLVFLGMALLAFLTGFGALEAGETWRASGIWFAGFLHRFAYTYGNVSKTLVPSTYPMNNKQSQR